MNSDRSVVLVSRSLPFHRAGGMEFVAWDLARALVRRGVGVSVLTTRIPGCPARLNREGVTVHALQEAPPGRYTPAWWRASKRWFRETGGEARAVLSVSAGAYGMLRQRGLHPATRFVMQAHGTSVAEIRAKLTDRKPTRWLVSTRNVAWLVRDLRAYRQFDRIVAVGPVVAEQLRGPLISWALPEAGIEVIENGIDTERFRPDADAGASARSDLGWDGDDFIVATVCRLHPEKGLPQALAGFAEFVKRRESTSSVARWLVVGDGDAREHLQREAARWLPPGAFQLVGEVRREEIPALLNAADVFLFTTLRTEGLPLNVLEAAATGLPLVLSHTLGHGLDLASSIHLVEADDSRAIADALTALEARRDGGRESANLTLPQQYTLDRSTSRYVEVLFADPEPAR